MLFSPSRIQVAAAAVMMLFAAQTFAAPGDSKVVFESAKIIKKKSRADRFSPEEREQERIRLLGIQNRTSQVFTLLNSELALQKGDAASALFTYILTLHRTKSPEVAERALEMAVSLNAFEQAEAIYQKWREIEPEPGETQKRMTWLRNLLLGKADKNLSGLDKVIAGGSEDEQKRVFLLLAQTAAQQPNLTSDAVKQVHKTALNYKDFPEAAIADAIFSAKDGQNKHAIAALQRLAKLDNEILPPTFVTLRLMAQRHPDILDGFFKETDTKTLSPIWQELDIANLIAHGQNDKAFKRLQTLLEENPNPDLYIQAALLSASKTENISAVNSYLEKAYKAGTEEQRSRAALIGAVSYNDAEDFAKAKQWLDKVTATAYTFDKTILAASIEAKQGNHKEAWALVQRAQKMPEQRGRYFEASDLLNTALFVLSKNTNLQESLNALNSLVNSTEKSLKTQASPELLANVLYQRSMVYEKLNQPVKAIADLRRVVELYPDNPHGWNALGYTLLSSGKDLDEAFKMVQTAYQMEPESAAINDSVGWAYYLKGDAQMALPYIQYAYEKEPEAEVAAHLGEVLWTLGDQDKAKEIWNDGLKRGSNLRVLKETMSKFGITSSKPHTQKHK